MIKFFVPGIPAPQGSKRYVGNGRMAESSKKVPAWRSAVELIARSQHKHYRGPVEVTCEFVMPRPKAWGKNRQDPMTERPDVDKLLRSTLDGLTNSGIIPDDSHVTCVHGSKRRALYQGEPTGARITIKETA